MTSVTPGTSSGPGTSSLRWSPRFPQHKTLRIEIWRPPALAQAKTNPVGGRVNFLDYPCCQKLGAPNLHPERWVCATLRALGLQHGHHVDHSRRLPGRCGRSWHRSSCTSATLSRTEAESCRVNKSLRDDILCQCVILLIVGRKRVCTLRIRLREQLSVKIRESCW